MSSSDESSEYSTSEEEEESSEESSIEEEEEEEEQEVVKDNGLLLNIQLLERVSCSMDRIKARIQFKFIELPIREKEIKQRIEEYNGIQSYISTSEAEEEESTFSFDESESLSKESSNSFTKQSIQDEELEEQPQGQVIDPIEIDQETILPDPVHPVDEEIQSVDSLSVIRATTDNNKMDLDSIRDPESPKCRPIAETPIDIDTIGDPKRRSVAETPKDRRSSRSELISSPKRRSSSSLTRRSSTKSNKSVENRRSSLSSKRRSLKFTKAVKKVIEAIDPLDNVCPSFEKRVAVFYASDPFDRSVTERNRLMDEAVTILLTK